MSGRTSKVSGRARSMEEGTRWFVGEEGERAVHISAAWCRRGKGKWTVLGGGKGRAMRTELEEMVSEMKEAHRLWK